MENFICDVRDMLLPGRDSPHGSLAPLLVAMTFVTGLVDAFSYLVLGHVFVANMTGDILFLGFALAGEHGLSLVASVVAFLFGAAMGKAHRRNERSSRSMARTLVGGASGLSRGRTGFRGPLRYAGRRRVPLRAHCRARSRYGCSKRRVAKVGGAGLNDDGTDPHHHGYRRRQHARWWSRLEIGPSAH